MQLARGDGGSGVAGIKLRYGEALEGGGDEGMVEGRRGQGGYGCCRGAAVGCDPCNSLRGA